MIAILHEDTFGKSFLHKILIKLKDGGKIPRCGFRFFHLKAMCNQKTTRMIKGLQILRNRPDGVIIIIDDDRSDGEKRRRELRHIPRDLSIPNILLAFEDEIEELILLSRGINHSGKSSELLRNRENYRKRDLPKYADRLDLNKIQNHPVVDGMISFINKHCTP